MAQLSHLRVAVIATDGFEESELTEPVKALTDAGAKVDIISTQPGTIQGYRHHEKGAKIPVDRVLDEALPDEYQALVLPGGALNADAARVNKKIQAFVRTMQNNNKPIASICHAPWILISTGIIKGRTLTSYHTIQDDIKNAGGNWVNQEAVVDGNWLTSRQPDDLPIFNREMIRLFSHPVET